MKKIVLFLLATVTASAVALAGDFRVCYVLPVGTTAITNVWPSSVAGKLAQLTVVSSASAITQSNVVSLVTGQYTNTIPVLVSTGMSATSTAAETTPAPVVGVPGDSLVCSMSGVTNTVPVYFYISVTNGRSVPVSSGSFQ